MMKPWLFMLAFEVCLWGAGQELMTVEFQNSAAYRWLNKPVRESRLLDDMESLANWVPFTKGDPGLVDARAVGKVSEANRMVTEMTLTRERSRDGGHSLRMHLPTRLEGPGPKSGRAWGSAGVQRRWEGEDWRRFNRLALWIYPDCPGFYVTSLELRLYNEGAEKLPALFGQEGETTVNLRNHEWNQVVWEIGNVSRDKVTRLEIACLMSGNEPEAADTVAYDLDQLALERVEPDYIEGWGVWPGRIAYSHTGYQTGAMKSAIASSLRAREFRLIDQATGETVLTKPVQTVHTSEGDFQVLDFSEVRQTGTYVLAAGEIVTRPFRIDPNVWRSTIWKALNFFYAERCGMAIPGVHGICHRDWTVVHGERRIVINGGWHDAGDLTQGLGNTGEIVYGLFSLAERLLAQGADSELSERLIEEAQWGLDWILKTRFGDGYRNTGSVNSRRTNGIIGDADDVTATARNTPMANFTAAAAEAIAYRVLKEKDPRLAAYSLRVAEADWDFAVAGMADAGTPASNAVWRVTFDSDNVVHEVASAGVLASVDLWRATGARRYIDQAAVLARVVVDSQQRKRPNWDIPLTGFFYTSPAAEHLLHHCHRGREQAPIMALTQLCEALPDHPDWMRWYAAVTLHSQYLKTIAKFTGPFGVLPASIYRDDEYLQVPESRRESFRRQVLNGIPLGAGHYLRRFPVWMDYRGHFGTILPQAQALLSAAHLRGDLEAVRIAQQQLEWVIGRNPFSQSMMWGEGYDFAPLYTPSSGDLVGALPVGIQTRGDQDVPYWPVQNTWTYKEVWVHPVARWIWLMRDLAGPALVEGQAGSAVSFQEAASGQRVVVQTDAATGRFRALLPEGHYTVRCEGEEHAWNFLPGSSYHLDLRPGRAVDFAVSKGTSSPGEVTIQVSALGKGSHRFDIRADNLTITESRRELILKPGIPGTLEWRGHISKPDTPWVALVVPDDELSLRKEVAGADSVGTDGGPK